MAESSPVQEHEVETLGHAQFRDGRRREGEDSCIADARKSSHGPLGNGLHLKVIPVAEVPVLQPDEGHAVALRLSGERDAIERHHGFHRLFFVFVEMANDLIRHLSGLFQGGSCRQDGLGQERSLVFIG